MLWVQLLIKNFFIAILRDYLLFIVICDYWLINMVSFTRAQVARDATISLDLSLTESHSYSDVEMILCKKRAYLLQTTSRGLPSSGPNFQWVKRLLRLFMREGSESASWTSGGAHKHLHWHHNRTTIAEQQTTVQGKFYPFQYTSLAAQVIMTELFTAMSQMRCDKN